MRYCERYAALLDLFVDGELPPGEMEQVQAHLAVCPGCQAYVDDALAIRAGFPDVEDTAVPEGFAAGVMERIRREHEAERKSAELRRRSLRRWAGTLGALAACCALVILVRTGPGGPGGDDGEAMTASDAAAPAECAMDAAGADGSAGGGGIAPQMAAAPAAVPETAGAEGGADPAEGPQKVRTVTTGGDSADTGGPEEAEAPPGSDDVPPADVPAAAPRTVDGTADDRGAALYLTAGEAGGLLDGSNVVWENAVEWHYELSREEYRALLEALGRQEEFPEAEEGPFLVVVSGPLE